MAASGRALKPQSRGPSLIAVLTLSSIGLLLVWLVATKSLAAHYAESDPEWALRLNSLEPVALTRLAESLLSTKAAESEGPKGFKEGGSGAEPEPSPSAPSATAESRDLAGSLSKVASQALKKPPTGEPSGATPAGEVAEPTTEARNEAARLAALALSGNSMDARAIRLLGQVAEAGGDTVQTGRYMKLAVSLSQRESYAVYWLMIHAYESQDYGTALHYADVLLRTRSRGPDLAAPVLTRLAENKDANSEVKKLLAQNPPWRGQFFNAMLASISDARTPLDLMLALKDTPKSPTVGEIARYLDFLVGKKFFDTAYYAWLQFLPNDELSTVGLLYNGSFERQPSGQPFDWSMTQGEGADASRVERPDSGDQHALSIKFGHGRVAFPGVRQMTMLAPGKYALMGLSQGLVRGPRGLVWRVSCAVSDVRLGESQMIFGSGRNWKAFEFGFEVPPQDCRAQKIHLVLDARSASEQLVSGEILFDELNIIRLPAEGAASAQDEGTAQGQVDPK